MTDYGRTHAQATSNADKAVADAILTANARGMNTETTADTYRKVLTNAHHVILNQEATIGRLRALVEEQRDTLKETP